jgi:hypothetical protein
MPIVICFTSLTVYHGRTNSQLQPIDALYIKILLKRLMNASTKLILPQAQ